MITAAVVLLAEAIAIAGFNWVLGIAADRQEMSVAGTDPGALKAGAWVMGGAAALYLLTVAGVLLRAGITDRAPGRIGRILVIVTAVVHGVLGALVVGPLGWKVFAALMVALGLLVYGLMLFENDEGDGTGGGGGEGNGNGGRGGAGADGGTAPAAPSPVDGAPGEPTPA